MSSAKVTSNGRITIPVRVRKGLGVKPGDIVQFFEMHGGVYFVAAKIPLRRLMGVIPKPTNPVSIEDMNVAIATSRPR
jgi:antitoxin PrlF